VNGKAPVDRTQPVRYPIDRHPARQTTPYSVTLCLSVIRLHVVCPSFTEVCPRVALLPIEDYAPRSAEMIDEWKSHNGAQPGDPAKLARALVTIIQLDQPP